MCGPTGLTNSAGDFVWEPKWIWIGQNMGLGIIKFE